MNELYVENVSDAIRSAINRFDGSGSDKSFTPCACWRKIYYNNFSPYIEKNTDRRKSTKKQQQLTVYQSVSSAIVSSVTRLLYLPVGN